ncbi:hypothetical protein V5O48_015957 [Marasmius crinis-equi]|uniref:Uncharacterized protein n=1 Tax=Marasmius crinis-equi TaxID=585013 RepID=A0ABR3ET46_9AGAR
MMPTVMRYRSLKWQASAQIHHSVHPKRYKKTLNKSRNFRDDIDPKALPEFVRYEFGDHPTARGLLSGSIIETPFKPYPPTPSKVPDHPPRQTALGPPLATDDLFDWRSVPSTPSHLRTAYTSVAEDLAAYMGIEPGNPDLLGDIEQNIIASFNTDDPSDSHSFHLPTDTSNPMTPLTGSASLPPSPSTPTKTVSLPPVVDASRSSLQPPPSPWIKGRDYGEAKQVLVKGVSRNACIGKLCRSAALSSRPATLCPSLLCKSCCQRYRTGFPDEAPFCKPHRPEMPVGDNAPATLPISADSSHTPALSRGRPLKEIHYQHRDEAEKSYAERTKAVVDRKRYEDDQKKQVEVMYWKADGRVVPFTVLLSSFPWLRLSDIPDELQKLLGSTVELFDPNTTTWKTSPLTLIRAIRSDEIVLLRAPFTFEPAFNETEPKDMQDASRTQVSISAAAFNPSTPVNRKRKAVEAVDDDGEFPTPKPRLPFPTPRPSTLVNCKRKAVEVVDENDDFPTPKRRVSSLPTPDLARTFAPSMPVFDEDSDSDAELPPLSKLFIPKAPTPSELKAPAGTGLKSVLDPGTSGMQANSKKAGWPYKLFTLMYEGFSKMETKANPVSFDIAFPGHPTTSKATRFRHLKYYLWAPAHIINTFKGTDRTWKEFQRAVDIHFGGANKVQSVQDFRKLNQSKILKTEAKREDIGLEVEFMDDEVICISG